MKETKNPIKILAFEEGIMAVVFLAEDKNLKRLHFQLG
jgi:hypothetical protein